MKAQKRTLSILLGILITTFLFQCTSPEKPIKNYHSETLDVQALTANTFVHKSYLQTQDYGKVSCNGLIFKKGGEAVVFDTPTNDSVSTELITWIQKELGCKVKAVVVGHFHKDCLGGLAAFHQVGAKSYANQLTLELAKADSNSTNPQYGINQQKSLQVGGFEVQCTFLGEGHSRDNIVSYIPSEKVLFGGCLIKSLNAGKGYVGDGNEAEWSNTVAKVKKEFSDVKHVVPGHGKVGDATLLDFTIELFKLTE